MVIIAIIKMLISSIVNLVVPFRVGLVASPIVEWVVISMVEIVLPMIGPIV